MQSYEFTVNSGGLRLVQKERTTTKVQIGSSTNKQQKYNGQQKYKHFQNIYGEKKAPLCWPNFSAVKLMNTVNM